MKCIDTKDKLFRWKVSSSSQHSVIVPDGQSPTSSSTVSVLRAESSPSSSTSRSRSPRGRRQSRSPPRTPRPRTPRVQSLSPLRDTPPAGSPRDSRRDTPTRNARHLQRHVCRNGSCGENFRTFRERNDHEINTCRHRPQSQVSTK